MLIDKIKSNFLFIFLSILYFPLFKYYIYLNNNKKKVVSKTLKYIQERLKDGNFARVHKSYLVNVNKQDIKYYLVNTSDFI